VTDEVLSMTGRRKLLTGVGTAIIGGAATSLVARAAIGDAERSKMGAVAPSVCVFDVNETLLDIEFLAPLFQRLFDDRNALREWFGQLILYSDAITLSGPHTPFFTLGQGVLKMLGAIHKVTITEADVDELRARMLTMPAHADVPAGLRQRPHDGGAGRSHHPGGFRNARREGLRLRSICRPTIGRSLRKTGGTLRPLAIWVTSSPASRRP
jgi:2-haloacid dehalogenase